MGAIVKTETIGGLLVDSCSKEMSERCSNLGEATKYFGLSKKFEQFGYIQKIVN